MAGALHLAIICGTLLGASGATASLRAQSGLGSDASADLRRGFTTVRSVRELADSRLLIADASEERLYVADWSTGAVQEVGRQGRGPGEYRSAGMLFPLGGDSSVLEDPRNGRLVVLDGARIVDTRVYESGGRRPFPTLAGADAQERVLAVVPFSLHRTNGIVLDPFSSGDSLRLVLVGLRSRRSSTLGAIRGRYRGFREVRKPIQPGGPPITHIVQNPLAAEEQALLLPDGWVAIAYADPYRVEWITPGGQRVGGAALPFERIPVDDRQRRAAVARSHPRGGWSVEEMPPDWPRVLPPFMHGALLATPGGEVVIRRTPAAGATRTAYDVVDRRGRLVRRFSLPEAELLIGIGASGAYVATKDRDDVQWLHRRAWPLQ